MAVWTDYRLYFASFADDTVRVPPLLTAVAMAFELASYGSIAGFLYSRSRWQCVIALYRALLVAMVAGRIVWVLCGSL